MLTTFNMAHNTLQDPTPDKAYGPISYHPLLSMFNSSHPEFPPASKHTVFQAPEPWHALTVLSRMTLFCPSGHLLLNLLCIPLIFPSRVIYY